MGTKRDYLVSLGLAKDGRGKFSKDAHAALDAAIASGMVFDEPVIAPKAPKAASEPKAPKTVVVKDSSGSQSVVQTDVDSKAVRSWANQVGMPVGARGRINPAVISAYLANHPDAVSTNDSVTAPVKSFTLAKPVVSAPKTRRESEAFVVENGNVIAFGTCGKCSNNVSRCSCDMPSAPKYLGSVGPVSLSKPLV